MILHSVVVIVRVKVREWIREDVFVRSDVGESAGKVLRVALGTLGRLTVCVSFLIVHKNPMR